jgi:hypothetical protein
MRTAPTASALHDACAHLLDMLDEATSTSGLCSVAQIDKLFDVLHHVTAARTILDQLIQEMK